MCGIVGCIKFDSSPIDVKLFQKMTDLIRHRGPDDEGYLFINTITNKFVVAGGTDTPVELYQTSFPYSPTVNVYDIMGDSFNIALSNRRLSILDPTIAGHQPLCNEDQTLWIIYNGEVYNYKELRQQLQSIGYRFKSTTDTEVVLNAYAEWGVECLNHFNGMWGFCIWDSLKRKFFCARDRFGIKPFYYYRNDNYLVFSSEIKSILELRVPKSPNHQIIYDFLKFGVLDISDETFFSGIRKLPQGHQLIIDLDGNLNIQRYWDLHVSNTIAGDKARSDYYKERFLELFNDSVKLRLRSDVPVGFCLSGGLDSSSIVCVANQLLSLPGEPSNPSKKQHTFSSCFDDKSFDEREYIAEVVAQTQVDSHYIFPTAEGFIKELDRLLWHQEEPFGGTSIYAQWKVMQKAHDEGIKVMLDGQGGDELLGGYRKFYIFYFIELLKNHKYFALSRELFKFLFSPGVLKTFGLREGLRYSRVGRYLQKTDDLLNSFPSELINRDGFKIGYSGDLGKRLKDDLFQFSIPVLLRYEDKNSSAHSIEARVPFLDYQLVEYIASLPLAQKMHMGWTKYILRQAMKNILPEKIRLRKSKLGFSVPEDYWFKHNTILQREVRATLENSEFIIRYVDIPKLLQFFDRFIGGWGLRQSSFFFRYFILEKWGQKYQIR